MRAIEITSPGPPRKSPKHIIQDRRQPDPATLLAEKAASRKLAIRQHPITKEAIHWGFGAATGAVSNVVLSVSLASNGLVEIGGPGTPGQTYLIQASTNLSVWQTVATNVAPIQFTDPVTNLPARFYRITR